MVVSGTWPSDFPDLAEHVETINFKELWVARELLLREVSLRGWRVVLRMDNTAKVHYVNHRHGRVQSLQELAESLELAERSRGCWALAVHIQGEANVVSDAGSRDTSFAARWNTDPFKDCVLSRTVMQDIVAKWGPFDVDLFCDRLGATRQASEWFSPERSAFEAHHLRGRIWAHPPRSLLAQTFAFLHKALATASAGKLSVALIVPEDPGAPWYRTATLRRWHRRARWPVGSSIFRRPVFNADGSQVSRWEPGPKSDLPILLLTSK